MGQYRELHLASRKSGRTGGTRSRPEFVFADPLWCDKYCLRNLQLPITWDNLPEAEVLQVYLTDQATPPAETLYNLTIPANCYKAVDFATACQSLLISAGLATAVVTDFEWCGKVHLSFSGMTGAGKTAFGFRFQASSPLAKMMGFPRDVGDALYQGNSSLLTYPFKYTDCNYLLMRSSMASGSTFTANTVGQLGSFGCGNVLAKVPLDMANFPFGTYLALDNTRGGLDTMFEYNGGVIDKMDVYFTREFSDKPLDLKGFDFSCTLGVWTRTKI